MANYLVQNAGHRCTYLGVNVPSDTLKDAVQILKPNFLLFFLVKKDDEYHDAALIRQMKKSFPDQKIFVSGEAERFSKIKSLMNFTSLSSFVELKEVLK